MRCLTLAKTLEFRGVACEFLVGEIGQEILTAYGNSRISAHSRGLDDVEDLLCSQDFDALILDDYSTSAEEETRLRGRVGVLVVIDDLANRPHPADLLIDPG